MYLLRGHSQILYLFGVFENILTGYTKLTAETDESSFWNEVFVGFLETCVPQTLKNSFKFFNIPFFLGNQDLI